MTYWALVSGNKTHLPRALAKAWGASRDGPGVLGPLPYHTAYIFPPADACAPSDDAQNSVGKQNKTNIFKFATPDISFLMFKEY